MTAEEMEICSELDYLPSSDRQKIARLMILAEQREREACAKLAESLNPWKYDIAKAIRERGDK